MAKLGQPWDCTCERTMSANSAWHLLSSSPELSIARYCQIVTPLAQKRALNFLRVSLELQSPSTTNNFTSHPWLTVNNIPTVHLLQGVNLNLSSLEPFMIIVRIHSMISPRIITLASSRPCLKEERVNMSHQQSSLSPVNPLSWAAMYMNLASGLAITSATKGDSLLNSSIPKK